ncbi:MAG: glycosyltransferase, partial [Victivallaceae bacterium]
MENTKIAKLCLVVPCYNEESILRDSAQKMAAKLTELKKLALIHGDSSILMVNDGSKDQTWAIITQLHQENPQTFLGIKLSANRGHQNALLAGLMAARQLADVTISLDADLQDDL